MFVVYKWPELKALKIAALFLGSFGCAFGLVCVSALRGAHSNTFLTKPRVALGHLSFFFNMGIIFSIAFLGFAVCIICINSIFWSAQMLGELSYLDNANDINQIRAIVIGFVALSSASCLLSLVCMLGCILIRPHHFSPIVNTQTFLWLTLASGVCGSFILFIALSAPMKFPHLLSNSMQNILYTLGSILVIMAGLSLGRFTISKPAHKPVSKTDDLYANSAASRKYQARLFGQVHVTVIIALSVFAALLSASFLLRAQSATSAVQSSDIQSIIMLNEKTSKIPTLHRTNDFLHARTNIQLGQQDKKKKKHEEVDQEETMITIKSRIQYYVLGSFMLVVSLYTLVDGLLSSRMNRIQSPYYC